MELLTGILRGGVGLVSLLFICYLLSNNRKAIDWKLVLGGIALQLFLAVAILQFQPVYEVFKWIADRFVDLLSFTEAGANFVLGAWPNQTWLVEGIDYSAAPASVIELNPESLEGMKNKVTVRNLGFMFAFKVLPTIIFFAAFSAMLYYFGILQKIIYGLAKVMSKFMRLSGAESIAAAANVFIGQTEAPLVVKPYLDKMTRSEIMALMTGGMATIAGGVFALFVSMLGPDFAVHFLCASIISAPAAIVAAKILYPEEHPELVNTQLSVPKDRLGNNVLDAISIGTSDGVKLAVNVGAMIIVFLALVALANAILMWFGDVTTLNAMITEGTRFDGLNMEFLLGMLFAPIAWLLGVPFDDITLVGQMLGKKTVLNEVIGYVDLQGAMQNPDITMSPKSIIIATYALCGFSNFSSIGIQIGGISAIAPSQRQNLTELGVKALIGGTVACFMTAAIAGMFTPA